MLTSIRVGNFKAFAETQSVPIRPLTLIYGANSSGKSSVLHSLILARHVAETGDLDAHLTNVGGTAVDLGGFNQYVHGRNTELRVILEWEVSKDSVSSRIIDLLPQIRHASIGVSIGWSAFDRSLIETIGDLTPKQVLKGLLADAREKGDQAESERLQQALSSAEDSLTIEEVLRLKSILRVESCWLEVDQKRLLSMSARTEGFLRLDVLDRDHEAMKYLIENLILAYSTSDHVHQDEIDALGPAVDELVPTVSFQMDKLFVHELADLEKADSRSRSLPFVTVKRETRIDDLKKVVETHLPMILEEVLLGVSDAVRGELTRLSYLGPLRAYPHRHLGSSDWQDPNWVAGGGAAWDLVRKDSSIRQKVNQWLGDEKKLSTAYEIRIRYLLTIENIRAKYLEMISRATSSLYEEMENPPVDKEGVFLDFFGDFEGTVNEIPDNLEKLESLFSDVQELVLFDKRSRTPVSHRDVGIGISQVLPVLVNCFALKDKIIAMEQPEIHLHPALQAELGDVFIEAALGERKNTLLIETHSEHLMLRILRRIRETSDGTIETGAVPIKPEDVAVIYTQPTDKGTQLLELRVTPDGDFIDKWPEGFFAERAKELF